MKKEIWKPIEDFKEKYEVSNFGRIKNKKTNHIYKNTNKNGDYFSIVLYDKKHKRSTRIHREVAKAFIPNPNNFSFVNHIDCNKQNNNVENLEWCTPSYNIKHAIKNNCAMLEGINKYNKNKFSKKYGKIFQYNKNNELLNVFDSLQEAYKITNVCARNILQVINHQEGRTQAGGFIWKSEKEVVNNVEDVLLWEQ